MMAGYDENGPQLYQVDPSGSYFAWKASAIGKNMVSRGGRLGSQPAACVLWWAANEAGMCMLLHLLHWVPSTQTCRL